MAKAGSAEQTVREIPRRTGRRFSAEEKIRIILDGLRTPPTILANSWLCGACSARGRDGCAVWNRTHFGGQSHEAHRQRRAVQARNTPSRLA